MCIFRTIRHKTQRCISQNEFFDVFYPPPPSDIGFFFLPDIRDLKTLYIFYQAIFSVSVILFDSQFFMPQFYNNKRTVERMFGRNF